jgi:hypothetical protein
MNRVHQAELDAGKRTDGPTSAEREELIRLQRENQHLRQECDILLRVWRLCLAPVLAVMVWLVFLWIGQSLLQKSGYAFSPDACSEKDLYRSRRPRSNDSVWTPIT